MEALEILKFSKKASARNVKKLLDSAIANAEHNKGLDVDNLFISRITVDEALYLKEFNPEPGAEPIEFKKRNCHVNITLENVGN